jgi:Ni/Fe-hydrogenase b-type cytochrome subunit
MGGQAEAPELEPQSGDIVWRHRLSVRLWHWVNAVAVVVLLMSGLNIFNAHPRLYWGEYGANFDPAWLDLGPRPFPGWATIPSFYSLADARLWHLAFAWVLTIGLALHLLWSLANGHLRRDLALARGEWRPAHIWGDVKRHARLRLPGGAAALRYNTLQKLAYGAVIFVLLPLLIVTGLAMSPAMDAAWPLLTQIWGGRQSARSVHFLAAAALLAFVFVHLAMVALTGPLNELRAMITGWYRLPRGRGDVG